MRLKEEFGDETAPDPDGISSIEDVYQRILRDAPYTPVLREVTQTIGSHSEQMSKLEDYYTDLERHLRLLGFFLIISYGIVAAGQYFYQTPLPEWVLLGFFLSLAWSVREGKVYIDKRKELREYADKYESKREV